MTQYIDPNSGAAPQPGGWAGPEGMELGHALPADLPEGVEQKRQLNEALYETPEEKTVQQIADEAAEQDKDEETDEKAALLERVNAMANPAKYFGEDPNTGAEVPEFTEEEASDAKALETEAVNLNEESSEEGDTSEDGAYDPSQHSVDEVLAYVEENPDQKDAVLQAEESGKNRKGVTTALSE